MLQAWHLPVAPFVQIRSGRMTLVLWLRGKTQPKRVTIRYENDNEETSLPMRLTRGGIGGVSQWKGTIDLTCGQPRRRYCFKLLWEDRQQWFTPEGFSAFPPARLAQFAFDAPDEGPDWVADQVFYQIFPDRFARSSKRTPEQEAIWHHAAVGHDIVRREWHQPLTRDHGGSTFYGGDLNGITEKLPYLKKLGVTALYLNPVFTAPSVHKYDTENYRQVDPGFGGDEALLRLRQQTQRQGMRLVLDGVFNHSGDTHPWFDRAGTTGGGALNNPLSRWRGWYGFNEDGSARSWLGYSHLPKLDFSSQALRDEVYQGQDSIVRHWLKAPWSMDGWRLDVVHMLGEGGGARNNLQHVAGMRQAARETHPDAYMVGEHFGDARQWLQADAEDGAMNYRGFSIPVWGFLANTDISFDPQQLDAAGAAAWMDNYRAGLSHQQQLRMFNQLDSHDTPRFKTLLGRDVARLPLGVMWLMCWPGVPCIYYGDEVGVDGENDPMCRKPFPWQENQQDRQLLGLYQRLAALRQSSKALRRGGCQIIHAAGDILVFVRVYRQERVLVALNRGPARRVQLGDQPLLAAVGWQCREGQGAFTEHTGELVLPACSATLWQVG